MLAQSCERTQSSLFNTVRDVSLSLHVVRYYYKKIHSPTVHQNVTTKLTIDK